MGCQEPMFGPKPLAEPQTIPTVCTSACSVARISDMFWVKLAMSSSFSSTSMFTYLRNSR